LCHVVGSKEKSTRNLVSQRLSGIANTPGMTTTAMRVFLTSSHPKMPNLILQPEQMADVIAYVVSLRESP
jgi:cytochrome c